MATIAGTNSNETLNGTSSDDDISGLGGDDILNGGDGNDTLLGGAGADVLNGGNGTDYASYADASGPITLNLLTGIHTGDAAGDTFSSIEGFGGTNHADTFIGSSGNDFFAGGGEWDIADYSSATSAITLVHSGTLSTTYGTVTGSSTGTDTLDLIEGIVGSQYNDILESNSYYGRLYGGLGNDTYVIGNAAVAVFEASGAGTDVVQTSLGSYTLGSNLENLTYIGSSDFTGTGNAENNVLTGGIGNDTLIGGLGSDTLNGGDGNDSFLGGDGSDILNGGNGTDSTSYASSGSAITINLLTGIHSGDAAADTFNSIESFVGTNYRDTFIGGSGNDFFDGGGDWDVIDYSSATSAITLNYTGTPATGYGTITGASIGSDYINIVEEVVATQFNDILESNAYYSRLFGGLGNDTYIVGNVAVAVNEAANAGTDIVRTTLNTYTLTVNVENLAYIGVTSFTGYGNTLNNVITGGGADDTLFGEAGNDTINGGSGNDTLIGGSGADTLNGGAGTDYASYVSSTSAITVNVATGVHSGDASSDILISIEGIVGTNYRDTFIGGSGNDFFDGGGDWDVVDYSSATSAITLNYTGTPSTGYGTITGASIGSDYINIVEEVVATQFNDILESNAYYSRLFGGLGNDTYIVGNVAVAVNEAANAGTDIVRTTLNTYTLTANVENLTYTGNLAFSGYGNSENNIIVSQVGIDQLNGYDGNDTFLGGAGGDTIGGGNGTDMSSYANSTAAVTVNLLTGSATGGYAAGDTFNSIENLMGSAYMDSLTGDAGNNYLAGLAGADMLSGGDGNDTIDGGGGADSISGGNGTDRATYAYATTNVSVNLVTGVHTGDAAGDVFSSIEIIVGSGSADTFTTNGVITLEGGAGNDTYILQASGATIVENANAGTDTVRTAFNYTIGANIEAVVFTGTTDGTITGNSAANTLTGGTGNDTLLGMDGNDSLVGGVGADTLNGGNGTDTANYSTSSSAVSVNLSTATVSGGTAAGDTLVSIEAVVGSAYADTLEAASTATLTGGAGNDTYVVTGAGVTLVEGSNAGTDTVQTTLSSFTLANNFENLTYSGTGNFQGTGNSVANTILAGTGHDVLSGGGGADQLTGGSGTDQFVYLTATESGAGGGADVISDFSQLSADIIDLSAIASFTFVDTASFSGLAGELRYEISGSNTLIYADINGDTFADMQIQLTGNIALTGADFVL